MTDDGGFLVPPWFQDPKVYRLDMNVASIFWGISFATAVFSAAKAAKQTWRTWKQLHRVTAYVLMIWGEWIACMLMGSLGWLHLWGTIRSSFWLWFIIVFFWCFQVQFLMQIIINRVALLMLIKHRARTLKWVTFAVILLINIAVFIVWIPARLQISREWVMVNRVWDRIEKSIFLIVDASLNFLFIYLVRTQLLAIGLVKYNSLFRFNICIIFVSISLDVALIGLMSLPTPTVYIQFQSLSYLAKLHIEMNMADLIRKVVRASNDVKKLSQQSPHAAEGLQPDPVTPPTIFAGPNRNITSLVSFRASVKGEHMPHNIHMPKNTSFVDHGEENQEWCDSCSEISLPPPGGIKKTVTTTVASHPMTMMEEDIADALSDAGSTGYLDHYLGDQLGLIDLEERGECSNFSSQNPSLKPDI